MGWDVALQLGVPLVIGAGPTCWALLVRRRLGEYVSEHLGTSTATTFALQRFIF
jgi:hypothetical protein